MSNKNRKNIDDVAEEVREEEVLDVIDNQEELRALSDVPSFWDVLKREFRADKAATFFLIVIIAILLFVSVGSLMVDQKEMQKINVANRYKPPSKEYLLGTDLGGRPILQQLITGGRNSLIIGVAVTVITTVIGTVVGLFVGYYGGRVDNFIMRIADFISVLPGTMLIITFVTIIPSYTIFHFIFIMTIFSWVGMTRLVRSKALSESRRDYVNASKIMGTGDFKIQYTSILPNISSIIITDFIIGLAANIGIETGLTFLGYGLPITTPSLGTLVNYARTPGAMERYLWLWLPASLMILLLMISINYVGQAVKRVSDAQQRLG